DRRFAMLDNLREEIVEYGMKLLNTGLTESTGGNLSVLDSESGLIAIKPSSVPYEKIRPQDVVIVDKEGNIVEGKLKPSSETPMHTYMYRNRSDIRAVIHTHAPFSTVLAVINKELPIITQDLAMFVSGNVVKVAPFRATGSKDLGEIADEYMGDSDVVLLQNHGTLAVGKSLQVAYAATWALERAAMAYCYSLIMGGNFTTIPTDIAQILRNTVRG
ncbi:class II aldolase/adducin family protein, partial [Caldisericum sp.]|uniref:class II aldolase/adducin family protein n=1 Tax=Caldisericum sp. TaxID=2499687 RepID=UPI003D0B428F